MSIVSPDSARVKTLYDEDGTIRVVADLSWVGGGAERFPAGYFVEFTVLPTKELRFPEPLVTPLCTSQWLSFTSVGRSRKAMTAIRYTPGHPLQSLRYIFHNPVPNKAHVPKLVIAKLEGRTYVEAQYKDIHTKIVERSLASIWNTIWRRVVIHLDESALKLARECAGEETSLDAYNDFVTKPEWRTLAEQSKPLAAAVRQDKGAPAPLPELFDRYQILSPATLVWVQKQRLLPVFGVARESKQYTTRFIRTADHFFNRTATPPETIHSMTHIKQWREQAQKLRHEPDPLKEATELGIEHRTAFLANELLTAATF